MDDPLSLARDGDPLDASTASPRGRQHVLDAAGSSSPSPSPITVSVPASPAVSAQVPSRPSSSVQLRPVNSSSGKKCTQMPAPADCQEEYDRLTCNNWCDLGRRRSHARRDWKSVLRTPLAGCGRTGPQLRRVWRHRCLGNRVQKTKSRHG